MSSLTTSVASLIILGARSLVRPQTAKPVSERLTDIERFKRQVADIPREKVVVPVADGDGCLWCRREIPCECMTLVRDGGPFFEPVTQTWGWSHYPERCMCTCGGCA